MVLFFPNGKKSGKEKKRKKRNKVVNKLRKLAINHLPDVTSPNVDKTNLLPGKKKRI